MTIINNNYDQAAIAMAMDEARLMAYGEDNEFMGV